MSKGFDFVAVAALVATLEEEENASFEQAAEAHKASAAVVEERRKRVSELQACINAALDKLKESPVWGTPWHDEQRRRAEAQDRAGYQAQGLASQQAQAIHLMQNAGQAQLLRDPSMQAAAQNLMNQLAGNAAQNMNVPKRPPDPRVAPPPLAQNFKPWE